MNRPAQLIATAAICASLGTVTGLAAPLTALASKPSAVAARTNPHSHRARVRHSACRSSASLHRRAHRASCRALIRKLRTALRTHARPNAATPSQPRTVTESSSTSHPSDASTRDAAAVAAALATPCADTELTPEAGNLDRIRAAVLCLVNRERAEHNENPLHFSAQLEAAAEGHCGELIADDYFAHVSPSGETPVDRIRTTGYIPGPSVGYVIGENLAWGTYDLSTPQAIVAAWIASPGHLANILEAKYTETGIGITAAVPASLANGAPGATYAQEFGVIIH